MECGHDIEGVSSDLLVYLLSSRQFGKEKRGKAWRLLRTHYLLNMKGSPNAEFETDAHGERMNGGSQG